MWISIFLHRASQIYTSGTNLGDEVCWDQHGVCPFPPEIKQWQYKSIVFRINYKFSKYISFALRQELIPQFLYNIYKWISFLNGHPLHVDIWKLRRIFSKYTQSLPNIVGNLEIQFFTILIRLRDYEYVQKVDWQTMQYWSQAKIPVYRCIHVIRNGDIWWVQSCKVDGKFCIFYTPESTTKIAFKSMNIFSFKEHKL